MCDQRQETDKRPNRTHGKSKENNSLRATQSHTVNKDRKAITIGLIRKEKGRQEERMPTGENGCSEYFEAEKKKKKQGEEGEAVCEGQKASLCPGVTFRSESEKKKPVGPENRQET